MNASLSPFAPHQNTHYLPGDLAMWCFILAELLVFGVFFVVYAFTRANHVELFNASQAELNRASGAINTVLLVTSSFFVVRAVDVIRRGGLNAGAGCARWLFAAMGCGGAFLVLKLAEFGAKAADGISMSTNTFYMFYLFLGFFHFMHVVLGMVILGAVALKARRGGYSVEDHAGVETGAAYWHMVDLVWIVLFPLIYVLH
ncbi:cytochrome c oxidase subunit 3 family protein [Noviherbaspirillum denitrificans]|uniref:Cytochrome-c oxidase n=1 Tax=Noviherbaspirillum denitrificans TaxID=1968433 RepID=A0A254TD42_9BURK|nr:cytochrome c oxidase subunit 3 family protein [Noviherbaspirillum denitrificans]OWW20465.1 cytochrome-c oxidase [Noviherbaspirillum denitrificans]